MGRHVLFVALVAGAFAMVAACANVDDDNSGAASCNSPQGMSTSPCSSGPQYPEDWAYPFPEDTLPLPSGCLNPTSPPLCTPHCSAQTPLGARSYGGLPSGSCTAEGEVCSVRAAPSWCFTTGLGARGFIFHCSCTAGSWGCVKMTNTWIVGSGCVQPDATVDGAD
jgi:hypothetical protein